MTRPRILSPRWQTPLPAGVVGSWGPLVEAYALEVLRIRFDVWQRRAMNRALAFDRDRRLVHRHYLTSAGRQNGKTGAVRALIGTALTEADLPPWDLVMGLAHDRAQARVPYTAVLADLEPLKRRGLPLALTRYLGIRSDVGGHHREYHTASREARDALRTFSVDLGVFDEIRTQRNFDTWSALEPTTRARPMPLIYAISSAGDARSVLLRSWWERGIRIIDGAEPADGFGMTWYAADDELAPDDPTAIRQANPAVAEGRIPIGPVAASIRSLPATQYRAETLNLWTEGADEWLPPGTWSATIAPQPRKAAGRVVLAVEAAPTWRRLTVAVSIETDAGTWSGIAGHLDAAVTGRSSVSPAELRELVTRLGRAWRPAGLAYSSAAASAPHVKAVAEALRIPAIELGPRQVRAASAMLRAELVGGRLTHEADELLERQVRVARPSTDLEGGDWYLSVRESLGEIDAIRAVAWATWAVIAPEARKTGSQIFVGR